MAYMGYVGVVLIGETAVRATSCDIRNTQAINKPPCSDGTVDNPAYHLGPMEVGGSIAFPATCAGSGNSAMQDLWDKGFKRSSGGVFLDKGFDIKIKYTDDTAFSYKTCFVDSFEISVVQGGTVDVKVSIIGEEREEVGAGGNSPFSGNTRIITWNDVTVSAGDAESDIIRSFSLVLANNIKRHYSLDGTLVPVLINPTTRNITGKISVMGRSSEISDPAFTNAKDKCKADQTISFTSTAFSQSFDTCIFEMEEIQITNDLFETTVNYHVLTGEKFA